MTKIDNTVCMLNIGLNVEDEQGNVIDVLKPSVVFNLLAAYGIQNLHTVQHDSDSEPTLVIRCVAPSTDAIYALAMVLGQDCIAVWNVEQQAGELIGPRADKWGRFDPARFLLLDGSRLA